MSVDATTLMNQAPPTIERYLRGAVEYIDEVFGKGYAAKHPELVGAFVTACAIDFHAGIMSNMADALEPLYNLSFIGTALENWDNDK